MNRIMFWKKKCGILKGAVSATLLLMMLVLPSLLIMSTPYMEDSASGFYDFPSGAQVVDDEIFDEQEVVEQAEALFRSQFTENRGQVKNKEVLFYGNIPNGMIGFGTSKIFIWLENTTSSIILTFENANQVFPRQERMTAHVSNYFLGDRGTYIGVRSSELVMYEDLWPGIDLEYRATPQGAKYEFRVGPGADPSTIGIRYSGYDKMNVESDSIILAHQNMLFRDDGLLATQDTQEIDASFVRISEDIIGFEMGTFNPTSELVIDPLLYSTYLGGSQDEYACSVGIDAAGCIYVAGGTASADFPVFGQSISPFSPTDVTFVTKFNAEGDEMMYSTFVGGTGGDVPLAMVVDGLGNVYVTGYTQSPDFPTVNAYNDTLSGSADCFVFKLNTTGTGLIFSTYIGGSQESAPFDIEIDDESNVYVVGFTEDLDFPLVNCVDDIQYGDEGFLFKLNATGNGLIYSTYLGGTEDDYANGVAVDSLGNAYVVGSTAAADFPVVNAFQSSLNGWWDGFILKVNATGNGLYYSTYLGSSDTDDFSAVSVDTAGNAYVTGTTTGADFPMQNPFDSTFNGGNDIVVFKMNATGNGLLYSTYFGGSESEQLPDITVNSDGETFVLCMSNSDDIPVVNAYDETLSGKWDIVVFKLDSAGSELYYATYLGGTGIESNYDSSCISLDLSNNVYASCVTYSLDFPMVNSYNSTPGGTQDCVILKLGDASDSDGDSLPDYLENLCGTDSHDNDSDNDLMPDGWEYFNGLNPLFDDAAEDSDSDLLSNYLEYSIGTLPLSNDTDSDTLLDGAEYYTYGTSPISNDTDSDLMPDGWEVLYSLNPLTNDTLDDPDLDLLTNYEEYLLNTNPHNDDTDLDTMPDGYEVLHGLNPLIDDSLFDLDFDSLANVDEFLLGTDPQNPDTDSDNFPDGYEVNVLGSDPLDPESPQILREPNFSTVIGGSLDDTLYDAIVDSTGDIYLIGQSYSADFPVLGAYDPSHNGNWDVIIVKLNSTGNGIIFSTYMGGTSAERGLELFIDSMFSIYLCGYTQSTNFPTVNAYDSTSNGGWDGFIAHLSANGSSLLYSTYIGGSGDDLIEYITIDDDGYLYGSGFTRSSNFPVLNAFDSSFNGDRDAVAFKMNPDLLSFVYSTFIGGSAYEYTYGCQLTTGGDLIISGVTTSTNFPTLNGYDSTQNGAEDIFVTRLNADGDALVFSTYIGGSGEEYLGKLCIDDDENLYVGGSTASTNFPTLNAYDSTHNGIRDAFALKLSSNGSTLCFSTYIGGSGDEVVYGVEIDQWNNMHLSGTTTSTNLPIKNAFQDTPQGLSDSFVFKINGTGNGLLYSSYLGGSGNDGQRGMAIDSQGRLFVVGYTQSADYPMFNALDDSLGGSSDGFVTCLPPLDDCDLDGIPDEIEILIGTNPFSNDTDADLMPDGWEYFNGLNPLVDDTADDLDSDLLSNYLEYIIGTKVNVGDTDSDSLSDGLEYHVYGTNPLEPDSDFDTLTDADEVLIYGTNPLSEDTDLDTMVDGWEVYYGLNPLDDDSASDADSDGLTNLQEYTYGTIPILADSDGDSLSDYEEVFIFFSDPLDPNSPQTSREPVYSTYLGGSSADNPYAVFIDTAGCIYVTGQTQSTDFPIVDAYDSTPNGNYDVFVVKFTADGQALVFSTFLGGSLSDSGFGIFVDSDFDIYICGNTGSSDFPVINAYDSTIGSSSDAFLLKLANTGDYLFFSTYIGGSSTDTLYVLEVDENKNIYAIGSTSSSDWPVVNAYDSTYGGSEDAVAIKMQADGSSLVYSTYIGGSGQDRAHDMSLDSLGRIVFVGWTTSSNFPTANAFDSTFGGEVDAFVCRLNVGGTSLEFSTFLGGSYDDRAHGVTTDVDGNVYVEGWTESSNFPTLNALYPSKSSGYDIFVAKFAESGTSLYFSTFIGGTGTDYGELQLIDLDQFNNIYVGARVTSTNLPTVNAWQSSNRGNYDGYFVKMSSDGQTIYFASYFGGSSEDRVNAMDVSEDGRVAMAGWTSSTNFPTKDAYDSALAVATDAFVIQFANVSDFDGDGLCDIVEENLGTSKFHSDTDSDLMPDGWEYLNGLNPTLNDSLGDLDADSLSNYLEYTLGTSPNSNDTDSDSVDDASEVLVYGTDPKNSDSDSDALSDGLEIFVYFTDPTNPDTDSDLMPDGWEVLYSLDPFTNDTAYDMDNDFLTNFEEFGLGTSPTNNDSDCDTQLDGMEVLYYYTDPLDSHSNSLNLHLMASTYLGGVNDDLLNGVIIDSDGYIFICGCTVSPAFPTVYAYDDTLNGISDSFVMKLDPTGQCIVWSTFVGGSAHDQADKMAIDLDGNLIVGGSTRSSDFPLVNAYDTTYAGTDEGIVFMLNSQGNALLLSTFFGGSDRDYIYDVTSDSEGNVYAAGRSHSYDFPVMNAYDTTYAGAADAIALKVAPNGTVFYATFIGGVNDDECSSIVVDSNGCAVIAGVTSSSDFPTANAYDSTYGGGTDSFVLKIAANGDSLLFSSFYGGSGFDVATDILIDSYGTIYVTGGTYSSNFPIVNGVYSTIMGSEDMYLLELDQNGGILYSTYFGGSSYDRGKSLHVDESGSVYIAGHTASSNLPTVAAYDSSYNGGYDAFILELNQPGNAILFSSYFGGAGSEENPCAGFFFDRIVIAGTTSSSNLPTMNAIDDTSNGNLDAYVTILSAEPDIDLDELPDSVELLINSDFLINDTDSDLMPDGWEFYHCLNPVLNDSYSDLDSDTLCNLLEFNISSLPNVVDSDWDTLPDGLEYYTYGTNPASSDSDGDLMPDAWEINQGTNATLDDGAGDLDGDSLSNYLEYSLGLSANDNDTDDDLMPDGWEYMYGLNATFDDSGDDLDGDLLSNLLEYQSGCSPISVDSDGDSLSDYEEVIIYGTHPGLADTDNDTLDDAIELTVYFTNPLSNDTDMDLMTDGYEVSFGLNPLVNDAGLDFDSDGLTNYEEYVFGTTPTHPDTDLDLLLDGEEVHLYGSNPFRWDTDHDSISDFYEVHNGMNVTLADASGDLDLDGLTNREEYLLGTAANNTDSDSDGTSDLWEYIHGFDPISFDSNLDPDNDGLTNLGEYNNGSNPRKSDTDNDFLLDGLEVLVYFTDVLNNDTDADLMPDGWEVQGGLNPCSDDASLDLDNDTLTNYEEYILGTRPNSNDTDCDGAFDDVEILNGCDPLNPDSDNDFMYDGYEIKYGLNPNVPDSGEDPDLDTLTNLREFILGTDPHDTDSDDDLISDNDEYRIYNTSPILNDTDGDSLGDGYEIFISGTDPLKADSDGDMLSDADELNLYGTDPLDSDSDSDLLDDYTEIMVLGTSPLDEDSDGDTMPDFLEFLFGLNPLVDDSMDDLDSDGLSNLEELENGTLPNVADTDGDTLSDGLEVHNYFTDPLSKDSDGDTMPDAYEVQNGLNPNLDDRTGDLDNDGIINIIEFILGTEPDNSDSDQDSMMDGWELDVGLDPTISDANDDPDADTLSNIQEYQIGTEPLSRDTDRDAMPDGWEYVNGLNPLLDDALSDEDSDGLTNLQEYYLDLDPRNPDSDGDTLSDFDELWVYGSNPSLVDSDADSISDSMEVFMGSDPLDPSSGFMTFAVVRILPIALVAIVGIVAVVHVRRRLRGEKFDRSIVDARVDEFYKIADLIQSVPESEEPAAQRMARVEELKKQATEKLAEVRKSCGTSGQGKLILQGCNEYLRYVIEGASNGMKKRG